MKKTLLLGSFCLLTGLGAVNLDTDKTPAYAEIAQGESINSPSEITLLNPGNEPKQELRLTPTVATKATSTMTMNTEMTMLVDGQTYPQVISPTTTITMEVEVTNVAENGDINADFTYTDVEVIAEPNTSTELLSAMEEQMNKLVGLNGSFLLDKQGNTKDATIVFPANMDGNNKQMLESMVTSLKQLSSPLPSEAVGIGAQWEVTNLLSTNGINLTQTANYELVDIQDNIATLNVKIEQQAGEQKINSPDASMSLTSLTGIGKGKVTMNLAQIMPISATIEMKSDIKMKITAPDSNQESLLETQSLMQMNLESKYE